MLSSKPRRRKSEYLQQTRHSPLSWSRRQLTDPAHRGASAACRPPGRAPTGHEDEEGPLEGPYIHFDSGGLICSVPTTRATSYSK